MSTPLRLVAFLAALGLVFAAAVGLGRVIDPLTDAEAGPQQGHAGDHEESAAPSEPAAVSLSLVRRQFAPGDQQVRFQVRDSDGAPVTSYDLEHEKRLHLIVLDTAELRDYQHVHPTLAADGTWTADLRLGPGTSYQLYADGSTEGAGFLATADLFTTGHHPAPRPLPEPSGSARVDGYDVSLTQADGAATLEVTRDGEPVALQPYLGALGHLVVIRVDDLSYLHVHPEDTATPTFAVSGLAPGRYRYFFDFQVGGVVRTASFTVSTDATAPSTDEPPTPEQEEDGHDH